MIKLKQLYDELAKVNEQLISSQKEQRALNDEKANWPIRKTC